MKALVALDAWMDKEAELMGKEFEGLRMLWIESQKQTGTQEPAAGEPAPTAHAGTEP